MSEWVSWLLEFLSHKKQTESCYLLFKRKWVQSLSYKKIKFPNFVNENRLTYFVWSKITTTVFCENCLSGSWNTGHGNNISYYCIKECECDLLLSLGVLSYFLLWYLPVLGKRHIFRLRQCSKVFLRVSLTATTLHILDP